MSSQRSASPSMSRRSWAALLALAAAPVLAQAPSSVPPQGAPKPPESPATPEARMQKAVDEVRAAGDRLRQIEVPMDVEPAFSFRA